MFRKEEKKMNKVNELEHTYQNKNIGVRAFSKLKVNAAIRLADLKKEDLILDFGCGAGWLKNILKNNGYNVIGYDIIPEQTDIQDYTQIKPDKIFVMDVFEHISEEQIKEILRNFQKMNSSVEIITAIPVEGRIWKIARRMVGKSDRIPEHITPMKKILEIVKEEFKQTKRINLFGISYLAKFKGEPAARLD